HPLGAALLRAAGEQLLRRRHPRGDDGGAINCLGSRGRPDFLAESPHLGTPTVLSLADDLIGDRGALALPDSPYEEISECPPKRNPRIVRANGCWRTTAAARSPWAG